LSKSNFKPDLLQLHMAHGQIYPEFGFGIGFRAFIAAPILGQSKTGVA
jgi:hypothetical protein